MTLYKAPVLPLRVKDDNYDDDDDDYDTDDDDDVYFLPVRGPCLARPCLGQGRRWPGCRPD